MAATAGSKSKFYVGTTSAAITGEVEGINSLDCSFNGDKLDTTAFKNNAGYRKKMLGLKDITLTASGDGDHTDTTGQNVIRSAFANGTDLYVKYLPDGVNGWSFKAIPNFKENGSVDGKHEVSFDFESDGAPTVIGS
jgi:predicted secreted protein